MSEPTSSEDIRVLLQSVETDIARTSPSRDQIRRSVLATFDNAVVPPAENEPEYIHSVSLDVEPAGTSSQRWAIGWMAAAAAILIVFLVLSGGRGELETTGPVTPGTATQGTASSGSVTPGVTEERGLSMDRRELPALLLPGRQTTENIAGGLSFDAPDGLTVISDEKGLLVLAIAEELGTNTGQLIIFEAEIADWEEAMAALAASGEVNIKEIGIMVAGRSTTRLDVTMTNGVTAARSCTIGEPCIRLDGWPTDGPAALWAGADNRVVEIGRTEDSLVLAIEASQVFSGPLSQLAAQVVNTASLSLE